MDLAWQPQLAHRTWWRCWEWYRSQCRDLPPNVTLANDTAPAAVMASVTVPAPEGAGGRGPEKGAQGGGSGEPRGGARWGQEYPRGGVAGNFRNPKTRVLGGRGASTHREGGRAEIKGELNKSQWPF